jgi:hypothetical protein
MAAIILEPEPHQETFYREPQILIGEVGASEANDEIGTDSPADRKGVGRVDELHRLRAG